MAARKRRTPVIRHGYRAADSVRLFDFVNNGIGRAQTPSQPLTSRPLKVKSHEFSDPCRMTGVRLFRAAVSLVLVTVPALSQPLVIRGHARLNRQTTITVSRSADPYRWLEDDRSPETARWVAAENRLTASYLAKIPYRHQIRARLDLLYNFAKFLRPSGAANIFSYRKNSACKIRLAICATKPHRRGPRTSRSQQAFRRWHFPARHFFVSKGGSIWGIRSPRWLGLAGRARYRDRYRESSTRPFCNG